VNPDPDLNSDPEIDISKCSLNRANGDLDDMLDEEQSIGTRGFTNSSSQINISRETWRFYTKRRVEKK
jgi:hypothetical protein